MEEREGGSVCTLTGAHPKRWEGAGEASQKGQWVLHTIHTRALRLILNNAKVGLGLEIIVRRGYRPQDPPCGPKAAPRSPTTPWTEMPTRGWFLAAPRPC